MTSNNSYQASNKNSKNKQEINQNEKNRREN